MAWLREARSERDGSFMDEIRGGGLFTNRVSEMISLDRGTSLLLLSCRFRHFTKKGSFPFYNWILVFFPTYSSSFFGLFSVSPCNLLAISSRLSSPSYGRHLKLDNILNLQLSLMKLRRSSVSHNLSMKTPRNQHTKKILHCHKPKSSHDRAFISQIFSPLRVSSVI